METSGLENSIGYLFRDTHRLIGRLLNSRLEKSGLRVGEWYILRALWQEEGITQRELSLRIGMGEPNVVTTLSRLEKSGIIMRKVDTSDNRRRLVRLTVKGRDLEQKLAPIAQEVNAMIATPLTAAEQQQLVDLIQRVRAQL